jgi:hypothetical protein
MLSRTTPPRTKSELCRSINDASVKSFNVYEVNDAQQRRDMNSSIDRLARLHDVTVIVIQSARR